MVRPSRQAEPKSMTWLVGFVVLLGLRMVVMGMRSRRRREKGKGKRECGGGGDEKPEEGEGAVL